MHPLDNAIELLRERAKGLLDAADMLTAIKDGKSPDFIQEDKQDKTAAVGKGFRKIPKTGDIHRICENCNCHGWLSKRKKRCPNCTSSKLRRLSKDE